MPGDGGEEKKHIRPVMRGSMRAKISTDDGSRVRNKEGKDSGRRADDDE